MPKSISSHWLTSALPADQAVRENSLPWIAAWFASDFEEAAICLSDIAWFSMPRAWQSEITFTIDPALLIERNQTQIQHNRTHTTFGSIERNQHLIRFDWVRLSSTEFDRLGWTNFGWVCMNSIRFNGTVIAKNGRYSVNCNWVRLGSANRTQSSSRQKIIWFNVFDYRTNLTQSFD